MFVHCLVHVFEQVPPETFHITSMAGVHVPHGIVYFDCLVDEVDPNHDPVVASDVGWNVEVASVWAVRPTRLNDCQPY